MPRIDRPKAYTLARVTRIAARYRAAFSTAELVRGGVTSHAYVNSFGFSKAH